MNEPPSALLHEQAYSDLSRRTFAASGANEKEALSLMCVHFQWALCSTSSLGPHTAHIQWPQN